jgi:uncharacterized protein (UPF0335 family)
MTMNYEERAAYQKYLKRLRDIASEQHTKMVDAEELIKKGENQKTIEIAKEMKKEGFDNKTIKRLTKLSDEEISQL